MAKQLQLRRGTTLEHSTFTGANGEVTIDTDKDTVVVHDGITAGGYPLATENYVDTIADLRATTKAQPTVWVSGYHTKGDGAFGSNIFEWDATSTEADNGGTIIKLDSVVTGRYKLKYSGAVNIKWFGAVGNCVVTEVAFNSASHYGGYASTYPYNIHTYTSGTDNRESLLEALASLNDGDTLYIPSGVYYISPNTTLDTYIYTMISKKNITIKGDGDSTQLFTYQDITSASFGFIHFQGCENITIRDIAFNFQGIGYPVYADNSNTLTALYALKFSPVGGGTDNPGTLNETSKNCKVLNCKFRINHPGGAYPGDGTGYALGTGGGGKLGGVLFYGDFETITSFGDLPATATVDDCIIDSCLFEETQGRVIWGWMTNRLTVTNNRFIKECGGRRPCIRLLHYNNQVRIANNHIEVANDWTALYHEPAIGLLHNNGLYLNKKCSITNNSIIIEKGKGIGFNGVSNLLVSGNNIKSQQGYYQGTSSSAYAAIGGIIEGSSLDRGFILNTTISNNIIDRTNNGIWCIGVENTKIIGNVVTNLRSSDDSSYGIYAASFDGLSISDNTVTNDSTDMLSGIIIAHSSGDVGNSVSLNNNYVSGAQNRAYDYAKGSTNFQYPLATDNIAENSTTAFRSGFAASNNIIYNCTNKTSTPDVNTEILDTMQDGKYNYSTVGNCHIHSQNVIGSQKYIKYMDGLMICTMDVIYDCTTVGNHIFSYPVEFSTTQGLVVSWTSSINNSGMAALNSIIAITDSVSTVNLRSFTTSSISTGTIRISAIGRWK